MAELTEINERNHEELEMNPKKRARKGLPPRLTDSMVTTAQRSEWIKRFETTTLIMFRAVPSTLGEGAPYVLQRQVEEPSGPRHSKRYTDPWTGVGFNDTEDYSRLCEARRAVEDFWQTEGYPKEWTESGATKEHLATDREMRWRALGPLAETVLQQILTQKISSQKRGVKSGGKK